MSNEQWRRGLPPFDLLFNFSFLISHFSLLIKKKAFRRPGNSCILSQTMRLPLWFQADEPPVISKVSVQFQTG